MLRFGLTIVLSAFLLFQVQPLIGKYILPWFGGGPAVWSACLLFFQLVLLVGYGYAHWAGSRLPARVASGIHLALLAASLLVLPITPSPIWKPSPADPPTAKILLLLAATVGLPYLLLSSTAPLIQKWFSESLPGRSPYRLYALSNAGSLLALLSYPFLFEPWLTLRSQVLSWSAAYAVFVILSGWSAVRAGFMREPSGPETEAAVAEGGAERVKAPGRETVLIWLGLSAVGAVLLLATTNQMCQEIAVIPFLWVVPLAIYLLTFVISFDSERWYDRRVFGFLVGVSVAASLSAAAAGPNIPLSYHIVAYSVALFACCMSCHNELAKLKPHPRHLTLFYLTIAAGGALGGVFVAVVAPRIFSAFSEYPLALAACGALTLFTWYRAQAWEPYLKQPHWIIGPMAGMMLAVVCGVIVMAKVVGPEAVVTKRSFYGILRLLQEGEGPAEKMRLVHGSVVHGDQFIAPERRGWPTTYYGPDSAIGVAMRRHPRRLRDTGRSLRVGVIGLGAGTIATYGVEGDYFRFYEINPDVIEIAEDHFTYVRDSPAAVEVITGDARVRMEAELADNQPQGFDILAVDAFSSDAIPIHLLTAESVETYWGHLRPDGLLLFHISNNTLNLEPVVRGLAELRGSDTLLLLDSGDKERGINPSAWMIVTKNQEFLADETALAAVAEPTDSDVPALVWTDDFAGLWQVLKF